MNEKLIITNLIDKLQNQSSLRIYQDLKLLATEIPLHLAAKQQNLTPAAVLVPFVLHEDHASLLLTVRTQHLPNHAGQVSFPGGKLDENEDAQSCALRETHEEIGLNSNKIEVIADLGVWPSYSGYLINPFIGIMHSPLQISPCEHEVEEVFEIPLSIAFETDLYQRIDKTTPLPHHYYELNYQQKQIWGFTAGLMLLLATYAKKL